MRPLRIGLLVVVLALAAVPDSSQAIGRRRVVCPPAPCCLPCPCPVAPVTPEAAVTPPTRTVTIAGKSYRLTRTGETGDYTETDIAPIPPTPLGGATIPPSDVFRGKSRAKAKTTVLQDAPPITATSVSDLIDNKLTPTAVMKPLAIDQDRDRVDQERFTVTVTAYIYGFKKESDNDYHVIIGDAPGTPNRQFLNVEISGIPNTGTAENRHALEDVRNQFRTAFGLGTGWNGGYERLDDNPVPVRITGSAFWDIEHEPPATVGPNWAKAKTAWEIHPISAIEFLPN